MPKEHYEKLAKVIANIFETRQKKFEVEFMLNLCLIYDEQGSEENEND